MSDEFNYDPDNPPWREGPSAPPEMFTCYAQGYDCDYELIYCECNTPLFYQCRNCQDTYYGAEWESLTGSCPICDEVEREARE